MKQKKKSVVVKLPTTDDLVRSKVPIKVLIPLSTISSLEEDQILTNQIEQRIRHTAPKKSA